MKKRKLTLLWILLIFVFIYLNRTYAHIYNTIDTVSLQSPPMEMKYDLGNTSQKLLTYVAIGDSLTAGVGVDEFTQSYPYLLAKQIADTDKHVVLHTFAVQGARSDTARNFIDSAVAVQPDIITILIGVNDIHGNVFKKKFQKNYEQILTRLTTETRAKIYLVAIPYIGASDLIRFPYSYYFEYQTKRFNETVQELADTYSAQYIDLYTQTHTQAYSKEYYSADLFHPSPAGYTQWSDILYDSINH